MENVRRASHNSTYKKLAVQWLNEDWFFVSSFVVADRLVLRNRQLLVAANRQAVKKLYFSLKMSFLTTLICSLKPFELSCFYATSANCKKQNSLYRLKIERVFANPETFL